MVKKKAPEKKIIVPNKYKKFLSKLLVLHNNLMHYYVIPYEEVFIKFEHTLQGGETIPAAEEMLVYYEPKEVAAMPQVGRPARAYTIYNILNNYLRTGILTKSQMEVANGIWKVIKESAR